MTEMEKEFAFFVRRRSLLRSKYSVSDNIDEMV